MLLWRRELFSSFGNDGNNIAASEAMKTASSGWLDGMSPRVRVALVRTQVAREVCIWSRIASKVTVDISCLDGWSSWARERKAAIGTGLEKSGINEAV